VATDFHQHTTRSSDSAVSLRDRVLANAAEAVEVTVASEHNLNSDLSDAVRDAGMSKFVVSLAGNELSTDASPTPWGHVNVYPVVPVPGLPRGGAPQVRDRSAHDLFEELRRKSGPKPVVQVNHPRSGSNGYFDLLGFDARSGKGTARGYEAAFDALEVWNGRDVDMRTKVLVDFFSLLRTSHPVTPIADTDTHGIVGQEAGLPRTYVRVESDAALDAWTPERTAELVRTVRESRDVVLTNGPFLRVEANGVGIGGVATPKAGLVNVSIHVASASFARVDHVSMKCVGDASVLGPEEIAVAPTQRPGGAFEADASFTVKAARDDACVVIATGAVPMRPMFDGEDREISPWAMAGAVWIDADGDGIALARSKARR
jgi:hypothetical protein